MRLAAPIVAAAFLLPLLVHCGGEPTCEDACANILDKCSDPTDELARNECLEGCAQRIEAVPEECASARDALVGCIADAESIDCADPQRSAACSSEADALDECAIGTPETGSSGTGNPSTSGGTGGGGEPCTQDDECATGICNGALEQCSGPGELGAACYQDDECASELCNGALSQCAEPAALGAACYQDDECVSELCNGALSQCAEPAGLGAACYQDDECVSGLCNGPLSECSTPGGAGAPCYQDDECASDLCDDGTSTCT